MGSTRRACRAARAAPPAAGHLCGRDWITSRRVDTDPPHTSATCPLRAGITPFDLSRYIGAGLPMTDRHYGHLARDGREHAIRLLDGYADIEAADVQALDVRWTPQLPIVVDQDNGNS